jgi:hypothetical protein
MHDQEIKQIEPSNLRDLVMSMYDVQHTRMILNNRFRSTSDNVNYPFIKGLESVEENLKNTIKSEVQNFPIHEWLISHRGISYDMAGQMIGLIGDIGKFDHVSNLWSYAGLGVIQVCDSCGKKYLPVLERPAWIVKTSKRLMEQYERKIVKDGETGFAKKADAMLCHCDTPKVKSIGQRKIKGTLLDYNPKLKSLCWRYGEQFVKQGEFYRELYDKYRAEYEVREDLVNEMNGKSGKKTKHGTTKGTGHIYNMAKRKTVKIFLSHLWATWRELEGLEVSKPWIIDIGGHSDYIEPPKIENNQEDISTH